MDITLLIFICASIIAVAVKTFRPALYLAVGWFIEAMVRSAEQQYKETSGRIDRRKVANEQIRAVLKWVGINPDKWNAHIDWLMDAAITRLPKTHTSTDDSAGMECTE